MIHSIFCGIVRIFSVEVEGVDTVDTEEAEDEGTVDFGRMSGGEVHAEAGTGAGMKFEVEAETEVEAGARSVAVALGGRHAGRVGVVRAQ